MMLHKRFLGILVGLTAVASAFAQGAFSFKISEVVVRNTDGLIDEYGERSGWIEIANTSWGTNNIRNCYLTTNREALDKGLSVPERVKLMSLIPKGDERTNLGAQLRIVFFADGQTNLGTLHTNFTLKADQPNFIALFDGNGKTLLDSITVPPLGENQSYARVHDIESDTYIWLVLNKNEVSPGAPNVGQGKVEDKVAEFKEKDPHGIAMSIIAMSIVFGCLLALYIFFRVFGRLVTLLSKMARVRASRTLHDLADLVTVMAKQGLETKGVDMKVYMALIAMALHEYEEDVHDVESNVLTYHTEEHSEWNAKGYTMREWPE
ncbi:MAG: OadG family protein [Paraprevotella sp.]|nr:OadG family protein [Paraprevotella sp.]